MGIFTLESETIRRRLPEQLPKTPTNLARLDKQVLVDVLDRYGDYWAAWLGKSSMFPEYPDADFYSINVLRKLIRLASGKFAQEMYASDQDMDMYEEFFETWDLIVQDEEDDAKKQTDRREKEMKMLM